MDVVKLLFSFQGRVGRGQFWLAFLIYFIVYAIAGAVGFAIESLSVLMGMALIVSVPCLISAVAVGIKRLHDRNKGSWWLLVFYLVPLVAMTAANLVEPGTIQTVLSFVGFVSLIWTFVELGCIRGTIAGNSYGPDPVAPKPAKH